MSTPDIHKTDPRLLAGLMELDAAREAPCAPKELATILRHQLRTPLEVDLRPFDAAGALAARRDPSLLSFRDLLHHAHPPFALLELVKQFAKDRGANGNPGLPKPIRRALYFASIVVSQVRSGRRITSLDDAGVRAGAEWLMKQPWVDLETQTLMRECLAEFPRGRHQEDRDR